MAIANPTIVDYKPFKIGYKVGDVENVADTLTQFGLIVKSNPYKVMPDMKEPYGNDWKDEDGTDEYVKGMKHKSYDIQVSFYVKAKDDTTKTAAEYVRDAQKDFFDVIKNGDLKIYDAYTGIGRQKVRYVGTSGESFREKDGTARLIFTVTFRVNDPVTLITL